MKEGIVGVGSLHDALHNYTLRFYKEFVDGAVEVDLHVARQPRSGVGGGASCPKLPVMNSLSLFIDYSELI
jgi:hypothetical protein